MQRQGRAHTHRMSLVGDMVNEGPCLIVPAKPQPLWIPSISAHAHVAACTTVHQRSMTRAVALKFNALFRLLTTSYLHHMEVLHV